MKVEVPDRRSEAGRRRAGFSLLEMLLVLGLLAVTAAIVWPALDALYSDSQLRQAAELVRARLLDARVEAMEKGVLYQFRYTPQQGYYQAGPHESAVSPGEARVAGSEEVPQVLPGGIRFFAAPSQVVAGGASTMRLDGAGASAANVPGGAGEATAALEWSVPIVFHPDGTSDEARLVVASPEGRYIELHLRSITAVVDVSAPRRLR